MLFIFEGASAASVEPAEERRRPERAEVEADSATERSPRSAAQARYSSQLMATYGDDSRGYLIVMSVTGFYRFLSYGTVSQRMSPGFPTQSSAIQGAYRDCQRRSFYKPNLSWVADLRAAAEALTPKGL